MTAECIPSNPEKLTTDTGTCGMPQSTPAESMAMQLPAAEAAAREAQSPVAVPAEKSNVVEKTVATIAPSAAEPKYTAGATKQTPEALTATSASSSSMVTVATKPIAEPDVATSKEPALVQRSTTPVAVKPVTASREEAKVTEVPLEAPTTPKFTEKPLRTNGQSCDSITETISTQSSLAQRLRFALPDRFLASTAAALFVFAFLMGGFVLAPEWDPLLRVGLFGSAASIALLGVLWLLWRRKQAPGLLDAAGVAFGLFLGALLFMMARTWPSGEGITSLVVAWALLLTPWIFLIRRPTFFTLWFSVTLGAFVLEGGTEWTSGFTNLPKSLIELLPAALFSTIVLTLGAPFVRRQDAPASRRAALLAPATATTFLCGVLPAIAWGLGAATGLIPFVLAGFLCIGLVAAFVARRAELVTLLLVGTAAWANAFVLLGLSAIGITHDSALVYALTLLNGLILLIASILCGLSAKRRAQFVTESNRSVYAEPSAYAVVANAVPGIVRAIFGATALALLVATALEFTPIAIHTMGPVLFLGGLALGIWTQRRHCTHLIYLAEGRIFALTLVAAGWLVTFWGATFEGLHLEETLPWAQALLTPIVASATALIAALILSSRLAFAAALVSPLAVPVGALNAPIAAGIPAVVAILLLILTALRQGDLVKADRGTGWFAGPFPKGLTAAIGALWFVPFLIDPIDPASFAARFMDFWQVDTPWIEDVLSYIGNAAPEVAALSLMGALVALLCTFRGESLWGLRALVAWVGATLSGLALQDICALPLALTSALILCLFARTSYAPLRAAARLALLTLLGLDIGLLFIDALQIGPDMMLELTTRLSLCATGLLLCALTLLRCVRIVAKDASASHATVDSPSTYVLIIRRAFALCFTAATLCLILVGIQNRTHLFAVGNRVVLPLASATMCPMPGGNAYHLRYVADAAVVPEDHRTWCFRGSNFTRAETPEACPTDTLLAVPADRFGRARLPRLSVTQAPYAEEALPTQAVLFCRNMLCLLGGTAK